jgi:hypothetical protein
LAEGRPDARRAAAEHALALPGQTVCRNGRAIIVDGFTVDEALEWIASATLPQFGKAACALAPGEIFVVNTRLRAPSTAGISGGCHSAASSTGRLQSSSARRTDHASRVRSISDHRVLRCLRRFPLSVHRLVIALPVPARITYAAFAATRMFAVIVACSPAATSPTRSPSPLRNQPRLQSVIPLSLSLPTPWPALRYSAFLDNGGHACRKMAAHASCRKR